MSLKIYAVVGLLTNLRWDWLKVEFFLLFWEGGKAKSEFGQ